MLIKRENFLGKYYAKGRKELDVQTQMELSNCRKCENCISIKSPKPPNITPNGTEFHTYYRHHKDAQYFKLHEQHSHDRLVTSLY
jgi:hypothetical protein